EHGHRSSRFRDAFATAAPPLERDGRAALADVSRCGSRCNLRGWATAEMVRATLADLRIHHRHLLDAALRTRDGRCHLRDDRPTPGAGSGAGFSSAHPMVDARFSLRIFCTIAARFDSKRIFWTEEDSLPDVSPAIRGASLCRLLSH